MQKVACIECSAMILPATAESTGGRCMASKQGIRRSIEASREFYKRQKEYDPVRELWVSLVNRCSADASLADWTHMEKAYFAVCLLEGEIYNGGFDQYFSNTSADYYELAIGGLDELGAVNSQWIVKDAARTLFGDRPPPKTQVARWKVMNSRARRLSEFLTSRRRSAHLERLDKMFWEDPDGLVDRLDRYAKEHGLVEPFRRSQ